MPIIHFTKKKPQIHVTAGVNLMQSLLDAGVPVASSCSGDGVCGKCKIKIITGSENLSKENETEIVLRERLNIEKNERISCQCEVLGDITVDTGYW